MQQLSLFVSHQLRCARKSRLQHSPSLVATSEIKCLSLGLCEETVKTSTCMPLDLSWWRHQMEIFSALLALCAGNSPVTGEFTAQRPVTRSFDVLFDLRLNKWLSKQTWDRWLEMPLHSLLHHCNVWGDHERDYMYRKSWTWKLNSACAYINQAMVA